jgi:hypothetical protein
MLHASVFYISVFDLLLNHKVFDNLKDCCNLATILKATISFLKERFLLVCFAYKVRSLT